MAAPTQAELLARRDAIDAQLTTLSSLPVKSVSIGKMSIDFSSMTETLRNERDAIERAILALDETNLNSMNGPEIIIT